MMTRITFLISILFFLVPSVFSQAKTDNSDYQKHFIGSTFFMIANLAPNPPNYYQLNYGYRVSPKDVVSIEAITWEYGAPLGIPFGADKSNKVNDFSGKVQAYGIGLAYKRFIWKGAYSAIHSTIFHQNYLDADRKKIQSGFQLFNTLRFGYQLKLFKNRLFIEPSIAVTYWPINTNLPESFQVKEDKWPNYFIFEPGLHFGVSF